jgi:hypothetical protein
MATMGLFLGTERGVRGYEIGDRTRPGITGSLDFSAIEDAASNFAARRAAEAVASLNSVSKSASMKISTVSSLA